jgi:hypothetical protein
MKKLIIFLLFSGLSLAVMAQQKSDNAPNPNSRDAYGFPEHAEQNARKEKKGVFSWIGNLFSKKEKARYDARYNWDTQLRKEWEQRMEANAKKYNKMAKEMKKPQYSDPLYFGHKQKPKKRPPGKKKYCHECGIRH